VIDTAITQLTPQVGVRDACQAVGAAQAGYYRRHRQSPPPQRPAPVGHRERVQPRALSLSERQAILDQLHSDRFVDHAPAEVWAMLLDEGVYLGSISTFYRLLRQAGETRERRRHATHPATVKPELVATASNQVWSWDITKLRGPAKWTYYHLYVILDIFSRYVVGWMVASRESAVLAEVLDPPDGRQTGHRRRPADHPRRPRLLDDLQAGGVPAGRPRRHPVPQPPARL
jgi:putative transposase